RQFTVAKLVGATGAVAWRHDDPAQGDSAPIGLALDGSGDVYVADSEYDPIAADWRARLTRRSGETGLPLWTFRGAVGSGVAVALHSSGDPVLLAQTSGTSVARVDRATGMEVWSATVGSPIGVPARLLGSSAGDLYVGISGFSGPDADSIARLA